jgi:hypothetical protein
MALMFFVGPTAWLGRALVDLRHKEPLQQTNHKNRMAFRCRSQQFVAKNNIRNNARQLSLEVSKNNRPA